MTDIAVRDLLDRIADEPGFGPCDPGPAISAGRRARHRRAGLMLAGSGGLAIMLALGVTGLVEEQRRGGPAATTFDDPAGRVPLSAPGGAEDDYPDLLTSRTGSRWKSIAGFGWPMAGQDAVSGPDGEVAFPPIGKADAEVMCLPLLNRGAPDVPDSAWRHSTAWIDEVPTRATLVRTFEAKHDGRTYYAECTLPGDYSPERRPNLSDVPAPNDDTAIRDQCGYLGHVDFSAWRVAAVTGYQGEVRGVALASPDGYVARCLLSATPEQRVVQVSADRDGTGPVLYGGEGTGTLNFIGRTSTDVAKLRVSIDGIPHTIDVRDGYYAAIFAGRVAEFIEFWDRRGEVVDPPLSESLGPMAPVGCFTSVETDNDGC